MKYVYGPLRSRRLGFSLGVSTVPYKICSFDCVYCQLKETTQKTLSRKSYLKTDEILEELREFFRNKPKGLKLDYVTFSGAGEPTLHKDIGALIAGIRRLTDVPVAVMTNASTLTSPSVRKALMEADLVIPSLDAVTQDVFEKIDRPCKGLAVKNIIRGLKSFRAKFKGQIWLEMMLVRGLNDSPAYMKRMKRTAREIRPDKIQLNTPVRTPALSWVKSPTKDALKTARKIFGEGCDLVC